jgi:ABC-type transport system involved in cytochrome c biogenesis permease component
MTFLPIVERELRVASRQRGTWWVRATAALIALVVGGWIMLIPGFSTPQNLGIALFVALGIVVNLYCLLAGTRITTDSLSEEKRNGTLGLLFLTDLKGYDIIFGKLTATSLNAFYGLLAVFPVMAIPMLLGGVAVEEFSRITLCAVNNLFFSLSVGMFCSAISRDEMKSMGSALGLVLLFSAGLPILGGLVAMWTKMSEPLSMFFIPSPGYSCFVAFDSTYQEMSRIGFNFYYESVACVHLLAWFFLGWSCYIIPNTWQDKADSSRKVLQKHRMHKFKYGNPESRRPAQQKMLNINPIFWLTGRDRIKPALVWLFPAAGALLWIYGLAKYPRDWKSEESYIATAFIGYLVITSWIGSESCKRFAMDRKSGALELILSTPISVADILRGQWAALRSQFLGPGLVILGMFMFFLWMHRDDKDWIIFWLSAILVLVLDTLTIGWVSMWKGLKTGNIGRSASSSVLLVLLLPWVIWGFLITLLGISGFLSAPFIAINSEWIPRLIILSRVGVSLVLDFFLAFGAWGNLVSNFRSLATQSLAKSKSRIRFRKS